jgi:hypothetical protein
LESTGDLPNVGFVRIPATLLKGPGIRDVFYEDRVLERLLPDPWIGELWPAWVVDWNRLSLAEEFLGPRNHLLEERERAVFLGRRELTLEVTAGEEKACTYHVVGDVAPEGALGAEPGLE